MRLSLFLLAILLSLCVCYALTDTSQPSLKEKERIFRLNQKNGKITLEEKEEDVLGEWNMWSAVYNATTNTWRVLRGKHKDWVAWANYQESRFQIGWDVLDVTSSPNFSDELQAYAAGYLEVRTCRGYTMINIKGIHILFPLHSIRWNIEYRILIYYTS